MRAFIGQLGGSGGDDGAVAAGAGAGSGVSANEDGNSAVHRTELTLTAAPVVFTDDPGVGQFSATKIYDFPAGNVVILGAVVDADLTLTEAFWVDTKEGDVALGSALAANGDALATTEQDIIPTTQVAALVDQAGPINAQSTAAFFSAVAGGTDLDLNLNIRIDDDAAHFANVVTNGTFGADTDWTKGTGWTIAAGVATSDGTQVADSDLEQGSLAVTTGLSYSVSFVLVKTTGSVTPVLGGTLGTARSSSNTFTETIVCGATAVIALRASEDFTGTVDTVTVIPLTGNGTVTGTVTVVWTNAGDF